MKFISWNVNGLRACCEKGFKESFAALDADFFCLQETKMITKAPPANHIVVRPIVIISITTKIAAAPSQYITVILPPPFFTVEYFHLCVYPYFILSTIRSKHKFS